MKRTFTFNISENDAGKTVRGFLVYGGHVSSTRLKSIKLTNDGIILNGKRVFTTALLSIGDKLEITLNDKPNVAIIPVAGTLSVLYEDDDILAIDKPPYMPVHPSKGHTEDSLANIVSAYYAQKNENPAFRCVTRLDKNTLGVVLLAKNAAAHNNIRRQFPAGTIKKTYYALVHGETDAEGTIDAPIARPDTATIKRVVSPDGARAVTHYKTIETSDEYSLLEITPETGRTHQIRVHMAYIGHPLCGDFLYGSEEDGFTRQMLHAAKIELIHPITGVPLIIESKKDRWNDE